MNNLGKHVVTLDPHQLTVLEWWLLKCCQKPVENYHLQLLLRVLWEIYEKKIYPKSPSQRVKGAKVKLSAVQTIALTMSFALFDWGEDSAQNVDLYLIQEQMPKLAADDLVKFIPPDVKIT